MSAEFRQFAPFKPVIRAAAARGVAPADLLSEWTNIENILKYDAKSGFRLILKRLANDIGVPKEQFRSWAGGVMASAARAAADNARLQ